MKGNNTSENTEKRKRLDSKQIKGAPERKRVKLIFSKPELAKSEVAEQNLVEQVNLKTYFDTDNCESLIELFAKVKFLAYDYTAGRVSLNINDTENNDLAIFLCGFFMNQNLEAAGEFIRQFENEDRAYILKSACMLTATYLTFTEVYLSIFLNPEWKELEMIDGENLLHIAARKKDGGVTASSLLKLLDEEGKKQMLTKKSNEGQRTPLLEAALNGDIASFSAIAMHMPEWKQNHLPQILSVLKSLSRFDKIKELSDAFKLNCVLAFSPSGKPITYFPCLSLSGIINRSGEMTKEQDKTRQI